MAYASVAEIRDAIGIEPDDDDYTARLTDALNSATDRVEAYCGRTFTTATTATRRYELPYLPGAHAASPNYYRHSYRSYYRRSSPRDATFRLHDFTGAASVGIYNPNTTPTTTLLTDRIWRETPISLDPGRPHTGIEFLDPIDIGRSLNRYDLLEISAAFGWPEVPAQIKAATILLAERHFSRQASPLGFSGTGEFGTTYATRVDADAFAMVDPYRRLRLR